MPDTTINYEQRLEYQRKHLAMWKQRLKPELYAEVEKYALATNNPDTGDCYRGQDLVQIIMDWPNILPCYRPVAADVI